MSIFEIGSCVIAKRLIEASDRNSYLFGVSNISFAADTDRFIRNMSLIISISSNSLKMAVQTRQ